jgi:hypothetical protein
MVSNDVAAISGCITDDWVLVTPEAGVIARERVLHVIVCGDLRHDTMIKDVGRVKVYGDVGGHGAGTEYGRLQGTAHLRRRMGDGCVSEGRRVAAPRAHTFDADCGTIGRAPIDSG